MKDDIVCLIEEHRLLVAPFVKRGVVFWYAGKTPKSRLPSVMHGSHMLVPDGEPLFASVREAIEHAVRAGK